MGKLLKIFLKNVKSCNIKLYNKTISCNIIEKHNLRRTTGIKIEFDFNRRKKHSFIGDNKLQVDQIKRKLEANFNKSSFI